MIAKLKTLAYNTLRWSEKYTKTDMVYLAHGGFWMGANQAINASLAFILSVLFANYLPINVFGEYKYVISVAAILGSFTLTGMNTAITRSVAMGFEGSLRKSFKKQFLWNSLSVTLPAIAICIYYAIHNNFVLSVSILIVGLTLPIINASNTFSAYLIGKKEYKKIFYYSIAYNFFSTLMLVFVVFFSKNTVSLTIAYFLVQAVFFTAIYFHAIKILPPNKEEDAETITYGKSLSMLNFFGAFVSNIDRILVFQFLGASPLATYSLATSVPGQFGFLSKMVSILSLPKISERHGRGEKIHVDTKLITIGLSFLAISIFYVLVAPFIFKTFFPLYLKSIAYSQVFVFTIITNGMSAYLLNALQTKADRKKLHSYNITTSTVQIFLITCLMSLWGIWGLVAARLTGGIFNTVYVFHLNKK